jgi:pimeloyl-ACP methyl ester carboxylesterase
MTPGRAHLVLMPGTLCDARLFARQRRALRGIAHVEVLDYRGVRDIPAWLRARLRRLPERFSVAGFSLGGLCALALLRAAPERVERLALLASNAEGASVRTRRRNALLRRLWHRGGAEAVLRRVEPAYFHHEAPRRRHAGLVRDMARRTAHPAALAQFRWAATRPQALDVLRDSAAPLLVVSGAHDLLCPRGLQHRLLDARPDARWAELPRCGHFLPFEAPARLSQLLAGWLQTHPKNPHGDTA